MQSPKSVRTDSRPLSKIARNSCSSTKVPMKMVITKKMATQGVVACTRQRRGYRFFKKVIYLLLAGYVL